MLVERIPEWHLTAEVDAEIAALLAPCFPTDFGGRSFFWQRHHLRLVIRDVGRIVGHMAITFRAVALDGVLCSVAGLAEVATHPEHRGKGIATALLQAAIAEARDSPAAYFLLFGEAKIYAAAGFVPVHNRMTHVVTSAKGARGVTTKGDDSLMVLPLRGQIWPDAARLDLRGPMF